MKRLILTLLISCLMGVGYASPPIDNDVGKGTQISVPKGDVLNVATVQVQPASSAIVISPVGWTTQFKSSEFITLVYPAEAFLSTCSGFTSVNEVPPNDLI